MVCYFRRMRGHASSNNSRNSDPVYDSAPPSWASRLPPIERRIIAGVETTPDWTRTSHGLFSGETRHYNLIARHISAPTLILTEYQSAELEGAILLACGEESVSCHEGVPSLIRGRSFRAVRSADLFFGGTISELAPGTYTTGDTIVDLASGRVFLELSLGGKTQVAVIGLFREGRLPSCVDWRVIERVS